MTLMVTDDEGTNKTQTEISAAPQVFAFARAALACSGLMDNPYFIALKSGAMSLEAFNASQEQFYFAVAFFLRPVAALVARMPSTIAGLDILQNLVEEHSNFNEQAFYCTIFQKLLQALDCAFDRSVVGLGDNRREHAAVKAFKVVFNNSCSLDELEVGIACMGIIEYSFARIAPLIGQAVVERGWVSTNTLVHYKHHSEID